MGHVTHVPTWYGLLSPSLKKMCTTSISQKKRFSLSDAVPCSVVLSRYLSVLRDILRFSPQHNWGEFPKIRPTLSTNVTSTHIALFTINGSSLRLEFIYLSVCVEYCMNELAATLHGSRPGVQSASLIMTSLMTSYNRYRKTETISHHEILWAIQWWKPHRSTSTFGKPEITSFMTS